MSAEVENVESGDSALLTKLQEYTLVTSAIEYYQNIKNSSPMAAKSLDYCESVAKRGIEVSIPVIKQIDEYTNLDERSVALLDALESKAELAKQSLASVNTAVYQPLDTLIDVIDHYVPVEAPSSPSQGKEDASSTEETSLTDAKELPAVQKLGAIGAHLSRASVIKLRELQLRGPVQESVASSLWDLLAYTNANVDKVGDAASDAQRALFNQAANAANNLQSYVDKSPTLSAVEHALQPVLAKSKNALDATAVRLIATLHVGTELVSHFFDNTSAPIMQLAENAAKYTTALMEGLRKNHPNFEAQLQSLLSNLSLGLQKSRDIYDQITAVPRERLHTVFTSMYGLINNLYATVLSFQESLVLSAKRDVELLEHSAPAKGETKQEESKQEEQGEKQDQRQDESKDESKEESKEESESPSEASGSDVPSSSAPASSAGGKNKRRKH